MTCRTLEDFYHIDGHTFEKQYKETLSGFRQWDQLEHADEWLLFPENIGPRLAIDESSLSGGELYTFVTNREARTREQSLVAVVAGTKAEDVIAVLKRIDEERRYAVEEVTLDLSDSMRKIVRTAFPNAKPCRSCASSTAGMPYSWLMMKWRKPDKRARSISRTDFPMVTPVRNCLYARVTSCSSPQTNGPTGRSRGPRYCLRNAILFEEYPDIKTAYGLCHSLRMIFAKNTVKDAARLSMARWYNKVEEAGFHSFNVIAATFHEHYDEILNFYNNRSSNAMAESFNAKIKLFRASLRGVADKKFFLFRRIIIFSLIINGLCLKR